MAYISVIILAEDVKDSAVEVRLDIVELVDVRMLNPVDQHLAADNDQERR